MTPKKNNDSWREQNEGIERARTVKAIFLCHITAWMCVCVCRFYIQQTNSRADAFLLLATIVGDDGSCCNICFILHVSHRKQKWFMDASWLKFCSTKRERKNTPSGKVMAYTDTLDWRWQDVLIALTMAGRSKLEEIGIVTLAAMAAEIAVLYA